MFSLQVGCCGGKPDTSTMERAAIEGVQPRAISLEISAERSVYHFFEFRYAAVVRQLYFGFRIIFGSKNASK